MNEHGRGWSAEPPGEAANGSPAASGLTFGQGWDRQDHWLRFIDPVLERAYRETMISSARRRFRVAAAAGAAVMAIQPIQVPSLGLGSLGPTLVTVVVVIAALSIAVVYSGRVGFRGLWVLACAASAVYALGIVAMGLEGGKFMLMTALGLAALGIVQIAWIRVPWGVAAAISLAGVVLMSAVIGTRSIDRGVGANQVFLLALALGCATAGSWFLEAAERRSFAQGRLVDHLYRRVDHLFRSYLSPDVAATLVEDPGRADLGGEVVEVSVLFADLRGYTPFAEGRSPAEVVAMLNAAFGSAVPAVFAEGGTIVSFVGDALMAIFNAPLRQPDHARRACRAALTLQAAVSADAAGNGRPRFRVGINTGPALVGNIGSAELRNFSALGDTTNTAARLQTYAPEGAVVIGERTYQLVEDIADCRCLGPAELKGKATPTVAYELLGLRDVEAAVPVEAVPDADRGLASPAALG